jgi:hypothetical protein
VSGTDRLTAPDTGRTGEKVNTLRFHAAYPHACQGRAFCARRAAARREARFHGSTRCDYARRSGLYRCATK